MALPDGIKLRPARRGDRDSIYRLLSEGGESVSVPANEQSNTLSWIVSHPETEVLLAVDPLDRGVGMISLSHRPSLRLGGRVASVESLVVSAAMRGKGVGSELLGHMLDRARKLGCKRVEMPSFDPPSLAFLERRGFVGNDARTMVWQNTPSPDAGPSRSISGLGLGKRL